MTISVIVVLQIPEFFKGRFVASGDIIKIRCDNSRYPTLFIKESNTMLTFSCSKKIEYNIWLTSMPSFPKQCLSP